jgi:hypothetical protein
MRLDAAATANAGEECGCPHVYYFKKKACGRLLVFLMRRTRHYEAESSMGPRAGREWKVETHEASQELPQ